MIEKGAKREKPIRSSWDSTDFAVFFSLLLLTRRSGIWMTKRRRAAKPPIGRLI
jgi:hypothetical protein